MVWEIIVILQVPHSIVVEAEVFEGMTSATMLLPVIQELQLPLLRLRECGIVSRND